MNFSAGMFKEILKGQAVINRKLDQIIESQTIQQSINSKNTKKEDLFSRKFSVLFPIANIHDALKVEDSLNDKEFYQYLVSLFYNI